MSAFVAFLKRSRAAVPPLFLGLPAARWMIVIMPRDGATTFSDLIGKLDVLRLACDTCGRDGCYGLRRLIEKRGREPHQAPY